MGASARVSATPQAKLDLQECATWLADHGNLHVAMSFRDAAVSMFQLRAE